MLRLSKKIAFGRIQLEHNRNRNWNATEKKFFGKLSFAKLAH